MYSGKPKYVHVIPEVYCVLRTEDAPNHGIRKSKENQAVFAAVAIDPMSIEWFIENQSLSPLYDLVPLHLPFPPLP